MKKQNKKTECQYRTECIRRRVSSYICPKVEEECYEARLYRRVEALERKVGELESRLIMGESDENIMDGDIYIARLQATCDKLKRQMGVKLR